MIELTRFIVSVSVQRGLATAKLYKGQPGGNAEKPAGCPA
jgi:hypothetical protein